MSRNVAAAVLRVIAAEPELLAHNRTVELADKVAAMTAELDALDELQKPLPVMPAFRDGVAPNYFREAADMYLGGVIADLEDIRRIVVLGPPFDIPELAAKLNTVALNGDMCWQVLGTYIEASTCAGNA